jgi:hypothetical protein
VIPATHEEHGKTREEQEEQASILYLHMLKQWDEYEAIKGQGHLGKKSKSKKEAAKMKNT